MDDRDLIIWLVLHPVPWGLFPLLTLPHGFSIQNKDHAKRKIQSHESYYKRTTTVYLLTDNILVWQISNLEEKQFYRLICPEACCGKRWGFQLIRAVDTGGYKEMSSILGDQ